jgi:hypothetical protein
VFAVLTFTTISNVVGCSTGSSAALAPFRSSPLVERRIFGHAGDQAPGSHRFPAWRHGRQAVLCRQLNNDRAMRVEEPLDDHRLRLSLGHCRKGVYEVIGAIDQHRYEADAGDRSGRLQVVNEGSAERVGRYARSENRDGARFGMTSRSSWRRLPPSSASIPDRPVTFPPGKPSCR